jgi:SAM-dependent methyltransferase
MEQNQRKSITKYFTRSADYYENLYDESPKTNRFRGLELKWRKSAVLGLLDTFAPGKELRLLDVGCGIGNYLKSAFNRGYKAFGMDITMEMAAKASETTRTCWIDGKPILLGDIHRMPFPDDSFDALLCVGVLQYLPGDLNAIKEISRVVKNGGIAIVTAPNLFKLSNLFDPLYYIYLAPKYIWIKIKNKISKRRRLSDTLDFSHNTDFSNRRYHYWQLDDKFEVSNLIKVEISNIGFGPLTVFRKEIFPLSWSKKMSDFLSRLAKKKFFTKLGIFANRWVFCLQKKTL